MFQFISGKLGGMLGQSSGYLDTLPEEVKSRITALKELNKEAQAVDKQLEKEIRELELKFHKQYQPIFAKRRQIIKGEVEPPREEPKIQEVKDTGEPVANSNNTEVKGIPDFWLMALKNNPVFEEAITTADEEALKFLEDINYDPLPDSESGSFMLHFHFAENPFFTNKTLTKTYHINAESAADGEVICDSIEASKVEWKQGKSLIDKKEGRLGDPDGSFFFFFTPPDLEGEDEENEPDEDDVALVEKDFDMAAILKDRMIHNAIDWFTGDIYTQGLEDGDNILGFDPSNYDSQDDDDYDPDDEGPPPAECKQQ